MMNDLNIANDNLPHENETIREVLRNKILANNNASPAVLSHRADTQNYAPVWQNPHDVATTDRQKRMPSARKLGQLGFLAAAVLWIACICATLAAFISTPASIAHLAISLASLWTSLGMIYLANKRGKTLLQNVAALTALISFGLSLYIASLRFGLALDTQTCIGLTAFAALALAFVGRSSLCLMASLAISGGWIAYSLSLWTSSNLSPLLLSLPLIFTLQIYSAHKLKSGAALILAALVGYGGLIAGLTSASTTGIMSLGIISTVLVTFGTLHYRNGKRLQDIGSFGAMPHTYIGWAVMIAGLFALQYGWLNDALTDTAASKTFLLGPLSFKLVLGALIGLIGMNEARRVITRPQSPVLILAVPVLVIGAYYLAAQPVQVSSWLASFDIMAMPYVGLAIGGAIAAMALGFIINGFRRQAYVMVTFGLIALCAQGLLIADTVAASAESVTTFVISLFICALISTLFAGQAEQKNMTNHAITL